MHLGAGHPKAIRPTDFEPAYTLTNDRRYRYQNEKDEPNTDR
jgi:hypothetical protein